jgi:hypothetical protein
VYKRSHDKIREFSEKGMTSRDDEKKKKKILTEKTNQKEDTGIDTNREN